MKLFFLILTTITVSLCKDIDHDILFDIPNKAIDLLPLNAADYVPCTDEKYLYCQYQFNNYIGYNGDWSDPVGLNHAIYGKYKQNVHGLLQLCHARTQLVQCFGSEYQSCTSRIQFVKKGANATNAYQISGIFNSLDFECSGGVFQATQHWGCIYATWNDPNYQAIRTQCVQAFYNNSLNSYDQVCRAGYTLAKCLQLAFVNAKPPCNTYYDLNWFECERIVNMFQFDGNCPNIACQVIQGSNKNLPELTLRQIMEQGNEKHKVRAQLYRPSHGHRNDDVN